MLEVLALKQKKCDEEAIKRKSKLEESRAKGKRLKKKKAAVTTVAADARSTRNIAEKRDGAELEEASSYVSAVCWFLRYLLAIVWARPTLWGTEIEIKRSVLFYCDPWT